ncbi:hypothetical protein HID58_052790 [Brassica napus]|uniref:Uncharacterized protein n=1 Tax=Brassica napus TaxID=3708 RepID=A0ABQ8AE10_BRANA|nr:hypothetical protein HID58_052790 [Brassica napus]
MEFLHNSTFGKILAVEENLQFSGTVGQHVVAINKIAFYYSSIVLLIESYATFGVDGCKAITPRILPDAAKQLVLKFHEDLLK